MFPRLNKIIVQKTTSLMCKIMKIFQTNKQKMKPKNQPKKYIAIVKININPDRTANCAKYRFDDLLKFTLFLDQKWKDWKWYNVYSNKGENKNIQLDSFTKYKRPISRNI